MGTVSPYTPKARKYADDVSSCRSGVVKSGTFNKIWAWLHIAAWKLSGSFNKEETLWEKSEINTPRSPLSRHDNVYPWGSVL